MKTPANLQSTRAKAKRKNTKPAKNNCSQNSFFMAFRKPWFAIQSGQIQKSENSQHQAQIASYQKHHKKQKKFFKKENL